MTRTSKKPPPAAAGGAGGAGLRPVDPALRQRAWAVFTVGLLSVVCLFFIGNLRRGVYVVVVALIFGMLAAGLGIPVLRSARRSGMVRPRGAVAGVTFGLLGVVLSTACLVAFGVFWNQLTQYQSCVAGANTVAAQQACKDQFSKSITDEINRLEGR